MRNGLVGFAFFLLTVFLLLPGCKKDKVFTVKGRLLLSRSQPVPVREYKLLLFQSGSGGAPIALGTSSSFAEGKTDNEGYFRFRFKEGDGTFFGIPTRNRAAATLSGNDDSGLPNPRIIHFPYEASESGEPLYLYKRADTVYLKLIAFSPIVATDTFTIFAHQRSGSVRRVKTGLSAAANTELLLDTITQAAFPFFNYATKKYINDVAVYKTGNFMNLSRPQDQDSLSAVDERSITLRFNAF